MWTIYSVGDYHYLQSVLNNVAALVGTGMPYKLAAIGMLLGLLFMAFQAVMSGGRMIQFQNMLLGWLLFALFFGPGVTVVIQDVYSSNTVNVDNVPFGVAAVGSIMSTVGHEITEKLEQAFSLPKMTQDGFAGSLQLLLKARDLPLGPADTSGDGDSESPKGSLSDTLTSYVADCTIVGIAKKKIQPSQIYNSKNPWEAMRYDSDVFGTRTYIPDASIDPPGGTNRTCTEAYTTITSYLNGGGFWNGWEKTLTNLLGPSAVTSTQAALDQFAGVGLVSRDYLMTSIMQNAYELGAERQARSAGDWAEALIISDAKNKRNIQWAAESSLFMTIVRPMMTFFEGFFYALSPFYAFLVVLVPAGISMAGKYFLSAIWIQTWMPVLAVLNHYVNYIAQGKLAKLNAEVALSSMAGLSRATGAMSDWLGTAGMLAASTPAITLTLVFGGSIAMTHLAGRMAGGDHTNEKMLAPDPMNNKELLNMAQGFNHDAQGGTRAYGAEKVLPTVQFGDDIRSSVQSSMSERNSAMQSFGQQFGQTVGSSSQLQERFGDGQAIRSSVGTTAGQTASYLNKMVDSIGDSANLTTSQRETLAGILGGSLAAGNGGTGIKGAINQQFSTEKAHAIQKALNSMGSAESGYGMQAEFKKALAKDVTNNQETFATQGMSQENKQALSQSAEKALSAEKAYQEANQRSSSFGMTSSVSGDVLAHKLVTSGAAGALTDKAQALGLGKEMHRLAGRFGQNLESREALALGAAVVLDQAAQKGNSGAREALLGGVSRAMGYGMDPTGGVKTDPATANKGTSDGAGRAGAAAQSQVQGANLPGRTPTAGQVQRGVAGQKTRVTGAVAGADQTVANQAQANFGGVQEQAQKSQVAIREQIAQEMLTWTKDSTDDQSTTKAATEKVAGFIEALTEGSGIAIAHLAAGVDSTVTASGEAWDTYKAASSDLINNMRSGKIGTGDALKQAITNSKNFWKETGAGFGKGMQLSAEAYWEGQYEVGRQHGLTKEQAGIYADYRSDFVNRALGSIGMRDGGAGDLTADGALARAIHGQENGLGHYNVDPTIGRAIAFAAQSGDEGYLDKVAAYNKAGSQDGGTAWYQSQGNKPAPRITPDMTKLLNPPTVGSAPPIEGFIK